MRGPTIPSSLSLVPEAASEQLTPPPPAEPGLVDLAARATALSLRVSAMQGYVDSCRLRDEVVKLASLVAALTETLAAQASGGDAK